MFIDVMAHDDEDQDDETTFTAATIRQGDYGNYLFCTLGK